MGITGLIPFLKKSSRPSHVKEFKQCTVAIDAYCWLHKGAFACADKLAKNEKTDVHIRYCLKFVNMLLSHNIKPIVVFDGQNLPSKAGTESKRRESREKNRKQAREYLRQGNAAKARECFQRCVDITSQMALDLMQACRSLGVDCIVAPYEADAQLAYLSKQGIAHLIITEDSDLLAFGCERVLLKMDVHGNGLLIEKNKLHLSLGPHASRFSHDKFRQMCILSGCDYLPSLPGIGLGKAFKFFSRSSDPDAHTALSKLPFHLNMTQLEITQEYKDAFVQAEQTFLYQLVFDPIQRKLVPLTPYPPDIKPEDLPFAGKYLDKETAFQFALGNLDSHSLTKIADYHPDRKTKKILGQISHPSIWSPNYVLNKFPASSVDVTVVERSMEFTVGRNMEVQVDFAVKSKQLHSSKLETEEILSTAELSAQYKCTEPTSPILTSKKRKISQSCLDSMSSSSKENLSCLSSIDTNEKSIDNDTPVTRNPFAKLIRSATELKKLTPDGTDVITSSYFETTPTAHKTTPIDPEASPIKVKDTSAELSHTPEDEGPPSRSATPTGSGNFTLVKLREKFQFNQGKDLYQLQSSGSSKAEFKPVHPAGSFSQATPLRTTSLTGSAPRRVLLPPKKSTSKMTLPPAAASMRQMNLKEMFGFQRHSSI